MLTKSLNHKIIITAFEDVYKEFSQMADSEFQSMIQGSALDSLGSLLYETNSVADHDDVCVSIVIEAASIERIEHKSYASLIDTVKPVSYNWADNYTFEDRLCLEAA